MQHLSADFEGDPAGLARALAPLQPIEPRPLTGAGWTIVSASPELLLSRRGSRIRTSPIKGTRPAGVPVESEKDTAEHVMIVDLERNDLGRVAETGSVRVAGFQRRVTLPTVHHLVSTVSARARAGLGLAELLRATFPGGSITGAPKLRAMEIIDELEGVRRGPYCGALGWLGPGLRLDLALAIRTAVWRGGELVMSFGGGIVADSTADDEPAETHVKAEAFRRALR